MYNVFFPAAAFVGNHLNIFQDSVTLYITAILYDIKRIIFDVDGAE